MKCSCGKPKHKMIKTTKLVNSKVAGETKEEPICSDCYWELIKD